MLTVGDQTETLFQTYSQFSQAANIPAKPTDEERNTEAKLEELLEKVSLVRPSLGSLPALGEEAIPAAFAH